MWFHYFLNVMSSSVLPKREFIELYRSFPCLQQVKNAEYSDRNKKSQAYETMIEKQKEIDKAANKETVTKKINSLRSKIMKSAKSSAGEDDIYKPTLWYFGKNLLQWYNADFDEKIFSG